MIKRTDKVKKLYSFLENLYLNIGDPVSSWKNASFQVKSITKVVDINGDIKEISNIFDLKDPEEMFINIPIQNGDEIILIGEFYLSSNKPGDCIKNSFDKQKSTPINYFTCLDCNLNWICNQCRISCHKKHNITLYKEEHTPTWACCYCYKKECTLYKGGS